MHQTIFKKIFEIIQSHWNQLDDPDQEWIELEDN